MATVFRDHSLESLREVAHALGINPDDAPITEIAIKWTSKEIPEAAVKMLVDIKKDGDLVEVARKYILVLRQS